ncbi:hypothetical protein F9U64_20670 [Gracilibacillus oryzae]|uniref:Uncharacterized protein n=1 Tax=Gracilibacillus oryzae TaxID=1672701 RepID=A0A7C8GQW0_9BACI|nr:hypothetical protein [Gracilibacillus oryzae]KAB8126116.1 hypothetical protein F9U64_20670 [Gracilibacillus oryzae]
MGHDIFGYSKTGREVAYARFSMGNTNATILYSLLEADEYYAGVSGSGGSTTFSKNQLEIALDNYTRVYGNDDRGWDINQIKEFIENCLAAANKEGSVKVIFG